MRSVHAVPGATAVLVALIAIAVTGCNGNSSSSSAATAVSQPDSRAAASPASPSATAASASAEVQNLAASGAVKSELLTAWAAAKGIPVSAVAGSPPGSIYYAYVPATGTYWALADYEPASSDSLNVQVGFQDGGSGGLFKKSGNGPWQVTFEGAPTICDQLRFFPQAVLIAWDLPTTATPASIC